MPLDGQLTVDAVTIDDFVAEHDEFLPDILKLDTQGSELSILEGAVRTLARVGMVEVEVEFAPIYQDQPLFGDVASFMADQGFELLYLNRAFVSRRQIYGGPSRGQVLFGDALFGKREDQLDRLTVHQQAKLAILLCQYGHLDIACQMVQELPEVDNLIPELRAVFVPGRGPAARALLMQVDKLLAVALHLRRYNHRATDSDRAWPIR